MSEAGPPSSEGAEGDPLEELRRSEQRLRLMIESVKDCAIFMLDESGNIVSWNSGPERVTGYAAKDVMGRHVSTLYPSDEQRRGIAHRELEIAAHWGTHEQEGMQQRKEGGRYWAHLVTTTLRDDTGELRGFVRVHRDVTEQHKAQLALRENAERLRAIVDAAVDAILTIDERGLIQSVNPAVERIFGYSPEEVVGRNVKMLMPEPYRSEHDGYLRNYLQTGEAKIIGIGREVTAQRKDGTTFPIDIAVSEIRLGERRMFTGMVHDITERRRLEQELVGITAAERRRIGQDLHDGICQELTGAGLALELIRSQLGQAAKSCAATPAPPSLANRLRTLIGSVEEVMGLIARANAEARAVARGLDPVTLETRGLPAAMEELANNLSRAYGANVTFCFEPEDDGVEPNIAHHVYRIAQEAANNALRHGHATHVWITFAIGPTVLRVEDDGSGFNPADSRRQGLRKPTGSGGMGLHILDYRARMMNCRLDIRAREPTGMVVEVIRLPHHDSAAAGS